MHICQTITSAEMCVRQPLMIKSHQVQNGGLEIVHVHGIFCNVISKFICFSVYAGLHATTGHPNGKARRMMVSSIILFCKFTLAIVGAAKFSAPYNKRLIK